MSNVIFSFLEIIRLIQLHLDKLIQFESVHIFIFQRFINKNVGNLTKKLSQHCQNIHIMHFSNNKKYVSTERSICAMLFPNPNVVSYLTAIVSNIVSHHIRVI